MSNLEQLQTETVVIGAGVVGLAVASRLAALGQAVIVVESGDRFGEGMSSRNSEVIHGGLYYPTGSLKARLCVDGRKALYAHCDRYGVSHRRTGKWIIATGEHQHQALEGIQRQAGLNGVGLSWHDKSALSRALPDVVASAALFSTETGIVDSHGLMLSLLAQLESRGGQLVCQTPVIAASSHQNRHILTLGGPAPCVLQARRVVNAAGLAAVSLAREWAGFPSQLCPEQYMARGCYFSYNGRHPFTRLIYPVPEPGGLGIHLTLDLAGALRFGPDVEWIEAEDYRVDPARATAFADSVRRWWPALDSDRLQPAYAGIRTKLSGPGEPAADFQILDESVHRVPGLVQLFGIESPGLTASLAIADHVAQRLA